MATLPVRKAVVTPFPCILAYACASAPRASTALERADLERRVEALAAAVVAAAGRCSLAELRTLGDGLAALVEELPKQPVP